MVQPKARESGKVLACGVTPVAIVHLRCDAEGECSCTTRPREFRCSIFPAVLGSWSQSRCMASSTRLREMVANQRAQSEHVPLSTSWRQLWTKNRIASCVLPGAPERTAPVRFMSKDLSGLLGSRVEVGDLSPSSSHRVVPSRLGDPAEDDRGGDRAFAATAGPEPP